jgi:hypothetical protein
MIQASFSIDQSLLQLPPCTKFLSSSSSTPEFRRQGQDRRQNVEEKKEEKIEERRKEKEKKNYNTIQKPLQNLKLLLQIKVGKGGSPRS